MGGIGVWWPYRNLEKQPLTNNETEYTKHEKKGKDGLKLWNIFNGLRGSSTRCEIGAALMAMQPLIATHIGIDNKAVVDRGTELIEHHTKRQEEILTNNNGSLKLGGRISKLQKEAPLKQKR